MPPNVSQPVPPSVGQAKFQEALQLHRAGRLDEAAALYRYVAKHFPDQPDAFNLQGLIALARGEPRQALELIDRAIKLDPNDAAYRYNRARALRAQNRLEAALAAFDKALALKPDYAEAWLERGNALSALGQVEAALDSYDRAVALAPGWPDAYANRGSARRRLEHYEAALADYERAAQLRPESAEEHYNRSIALLDLDHLDAALEASGRAVALRPSWAAAWSHRGHVLRRMKRLDEALAAHDRALALEPDHFEAVYNRALALHDLKRMGQALAGLDRAVALRPDFVDPQMTRACTLLATGDFARGWPAYEVRWGRPMLQRIKRDWSRPLWLGRQPLAGRTLLLHAEQGLGDTIHFARYAALAAEQGARVILEVQPPLVELMRTLRGVDQVIARGEDLPAFDLQAPLLSLPLAFGTTLESIPAAPTYLSADPSKAAAWAERLGPKPAPRIGLVWSGNALQENDRNRSIPLAALLPYLPEGLDYISLQNEVREADRAALDAGGVRHFGEDLRDFTDTAALCSQMDAVVSICTSGAHLAGALGKDTLMMLTNVGVCWRWLGERDDSPWYPSMTLYRQGLDNDWRPVFGRVGRALQTLTTPSP